MSAARNAITLQTKSMQNTKNINGLPRSEQTHGSRIRQRRTRMAAADEWKDGWPKKPGWYKCLVDEDVEMELKFYICQVSCKPHWVDKDGDYIETQYKVKWK